MHPWAVSAIGNRIAGRERPLKEPSMINPLWALLAVVLALMPFAVGDAIRWK